MADRDATTQFELDGPRFNALSNAVIAGEAGAQGVSACWAAMTDEDRKVWIEESRTRWPRLDRYLPILLAAADSIIEADNAARLEES